MTANPPACEYANWNPAEEGYGESWVGPCWGPVEIEYRNDCYEDEDGEHVCGYVSAPCCRGHRACHCWFEAYEPEPPPKPPELPREPTSSGPRYCSLCAVEIRDGEDFVARSNDDVGWYFQQMIVTRGSTTYQHIDRELCGRRQIADLCRDLTPAQLEAAKVTEWTRDGRVVAFQLPAGVEIGGMVVRQRTAPASSSGSE